MDEEKKRFIDAIGNPSRLKILLVLWIYPNPASTRFLLGRLFSLLARAS